MRRLSVTVEKQEMILLTGFYEDADLRRRGEILECVRRNTGNDHIDEIHLFVEGPLDADGLLAAYPPLAAAKIRLIPQGRRVTYRRLFDYANERLPGRRVIIANADIYFDHTLARLGAYDLSGKLLCLSRWDAQSDGSARFFDHPASQDAWIFQTPIREFPCDWSLGVPGCDNRLAWEAERAGLALSNPSRSLRACHLHSSGVRRYSEAHRLAGPTRQVFARFLEAPRPAPNLPCASVAFRESMGYTIARLEVGASSHNNDPRPFAAVPAPLAGLEFTQVVSMSVSPVEVEFITAGKLYALVGNDWEGYYPATTWLVEEGFKEDLPLVETRRGNAFEVWSLVGEAGRRFVIPTQVMLAADRLVIEDCGLRIADSQLSNDRPEITALIKSENRSRTEPGENQSAILDPQSSIFALTSLPSSAESAPLIADCIASWRRAGLRVVAFNHPSELGRLASLYDADFAPVEETTINLFGKHFIPIKAMLDWAAERNAPALLINADIQLRLEEWEVKRLRRLADGGLLYFVRHNHDGDLARAERERHGIDAFLFHGSDVAQFPDSFLSMGQPGWDYWLPHMFLARGRPVYAVEFPAAFHRRHPLRWSWENWRRCAIEFARVTGELNGDQSFEACVAMFTRVRQNFDRLRTASPQSPPRIREWVQQTFRRPGPKTFLELGAHQGDDTAWMAEIPGVTIHAFEPDPRNHQPPRPNVTLRRAAIADRDGSGSLILSEKGWGQEWTLSSSIKRPKNHLSRYPVTFGEAVEVEFITLDTFYRRQGLDFVDFIWADIQGAEGEMIRGGRDCLTRTRYLYTGYSDDELYENQATLKEILETLPDFRVLELWPDEVLLQNRNLNH
jgi:2-O-methyltransferase